MLGPQATFTNLSLFYSRHLLGALHNVATVLLHNHVISRVNPFTTTVLTVLEGSVAQGKDEYLKKRSKVHFG